MLCLAITGRFLTGDGRGLGGRVHSECCLECFCLVLGIEQTASVQHLGAGTAQEARQHEGTGELGQGLLGFLNHQSLRGCEGSRPQQGSPRPSPQGWKVLASGNPVLNPEEALASWPGWGTSVMGR